MAFQPNESLSFELFECTLPVRRLKHSYTLTSDGSGTVVRQRMEYELKFGPIGKLMDAVMVRKKWDAGIKGFFEKKMFWWPGLPAGRQDVLRDREG